MRSKPVSYCSTPSLSEAGGFFSEEMSQSRSFVRLDSTPRTLGPPSFESGLPTVEEHTSRLDECLTALCTCGDNRWLIRQRQLHPNCTRMMMSLTLILIVTFLGGLCFSLAEYDEEKRLIGKKKRLFDEILYGLEHNETVNNATHKLKELMRMKDIPDRERDNRWTVRRAWFFAFTTASTIGYGFTFPRSRAGKVMLVFYSFAAIAVFGLSVSKIANILVRKLDSMVGQRYLRSSLIIATNILCIFLGALLLDLEEGQRSTQWSILDGCYFMVESVTTVGFGDAQPKAVLIYGSTGAIIFIFIGLISTALLLKSMQDWLNFKITRWRRDRTSIASEMRFFQLSR